ncbi:LOG family protein, partial [Rhizobium ruizarguesonis]
VFPGGFGTLDEVFVCLTQIQSGRKERLPLILFGESFWRRIINLEAVAEFGTIAPDDVKLIRFVDTSKAAMKIEQDIYEHR